MPAFVRELIASLGAGTGSALLNDSETAPAHGRQRYREGFDVDQVIREYGILGEVILEMVAEMDGTITAGEARILLTSLDTGAAEAVVEYGRKRDEEARQQNARHLSFVAHELRSPLGAAWTALDIVRRTLEQAPSRALELLDRSLARLRELIDHVLVAGRLEAGVAPQYGEVALEPLLHAVEADALPQADDRGLALVVDATPGLRVDADERLLLSAIGNLVRNAVKFSRAGGTITVRAREAGEDAVIRVEDACGGLPPGTGPEVFEPFVQRGDDRTGLGLGLAIVHQAVAAHGGTVELRNLPGTGCVFTIRLPRSRSA
jgi:signal transduction histidine kinase